LVGTEGGSAHFFMAGVPGTVNSYNNSTEIDTANTVTGGQLVKAALSVDAAGNRLLVSNGGTVASGSGGFGSSTTIYLGSQNGTGSFLNGYIPQCSVFSGARSAAQLQALTQ